MTSFKSLGLREDVLKGIEELGFQSPTPIQEKVIGYLLEENSDVIALAQTGTGKTAAFGLPACQMSDCNEDCIQTLVLAPTRELCIQISREIKNYSKYVKDLRVEPVYGGESIEKQIKSISTPPQILVATPGRLVDLIKRKKVNLSLVNRVVLDEADEMLDMGFEEDIQFILGKTPDTRRTLLFSATMSKEVLQVAEQYMVDPVEIEAGKRNTGTSNVSHHFYLVENRNRYNALKRLSDLYPEIYSIVFCRTRRECQEISDALTKDGYNADTLHGDLSQAQRDSVMKKFRDKNLNLLVATDVAARGIDVQNLSHVINYNLPDDIETYTHRSGRTGRANNTGVSIALITPSEKYKLKQIERKLQKQFEQKQLPKAEEVLQQQVYSFVEKVEKLEVNNDQIQSFMDEIYERLEGMDKKQLIDQFVGHEIQRFLSYYKNAPDLNVRNQDDRRDGRDRDNGRDGGRDKRSRDRDRDKNKVKLEINVGSAEGINPGRLLGIINEVWGDSSLQIGRIDIQRKFTVFELEPDDSEKLLSLSKKRLTEQGMKISPSTFVNTSSSSDNGGGYRRRGGSGGGNSRGGSGSGSGGSSRGGGSGSGSGSGSGGNRDWKRRRA